jgi:two-component system nitrogen regulation sensor histidine kinase NtrY
MDVKSVDPQVAAQQEIDEAKKRRREIIIVFFVAFIFLFLTWFEIRLFGISQELPFVHSIFFFGLVNFNIILLLLLLFLIFRNIIKVFVERKSKLFGSSLKSKLVIGFVSFAVIPTFLLLLTSIFYINSSFDKWFSSKISGVLKSSLEVTNAYYFNAKKRNYHFAHEIASKLSQQFKVDNKSKSKKSKNNSASRIHDSGSVQDKIKFYRESFLLDAVEYYPSLFGRRELVVSNDEIIPLIPPVALEFLQKGIKAQVEASSIHQFGEGNLIRVIVPVEEGHEWGAIVVSSFVPLSLTSKMNDISTTFEELRDISVLEYPLKSIYLMILLLMSFLIVFAATWFGFHLAKQLSIPLVQLGKATRRLAEGEFFTLDIKSGSEEVTDLISSFNQMTNQLEHSQMEIQRTNRELKHTLSDLDQNLRYIEVVLGNVSTGVISVDQKGKITTFNQHAENLLKVKATDYTGRSLKRLINRDQMNLFIGLLRLMRENKVDVIQKEIQMTLNGEILPINISLTLLKNDKHKEIGKVLVFDDMSHIVNAQRAQAWSEVAKRIAHEIKNPLTPIKLSAERLQRKFANQIQDAAFMDCTSMIIRQTDELKDMVNEFSQFARLPQAKLVEGSLNSVIEETLKIYKTSHPQVTINFQSDESLTLFKFDPSQMGRVIVNLIENSVAAISRENKPEIKVSTVFDSSLKIVKVVVADNGPGISPNMRGKIFDPYFSTKENGTGLGLSIVKRIIEDHNGFIRATANEPRGLKMMIELPVNIYKT